VSRAPLTSRLLTISSSIIPFYRGSLAAPFQVGAQPSMSDQGQVNGRSVIGALFYVSFIVLAAFVTLKIFTGVVFANMYGSAQERMVTDLQREFAHAQQLVKNARPLEAERPGGFCGRREPATLWDVRLRNFVYDLVVPCGCSRLSCTRRYHWSHGLYEYFGFVVILLNVCFMMTEGYDPSDSWTRVLTISNEVFLVYFAVELILFLLALGPRRYVRDPWQLLDGVVVLISLATEVWYFSANDAANQNGAGGGGGGGNGRTDSTSYTTSRSSQALRLLRISRVLRLLKRFKSLRMLIGAVIVSIGPILNVVFILCGFVYLFNLVGLGLFWDVSVNNPVYAPNLDGIDARHVNFEEFGGGFVALFRALTGDGWVDTMHDVQLKSPVTGFVFFAAFVFFGMFIMVELFLSVVIRSFRFLSASSNTLLTLDDLEHFKAVWLHMDLDSEGKSDGAIPSFRLRKFLVLLSRLPIGPPIDDNAAADRLEKARIRSSLLAVTGAPRSGGYYGGSVGGTTVVTPRVFSAEEVVSAMGQPTLSPQAVEKLRGRAEATRGDTPKKELPRR
jgi:hypothetical protein